MINKGVSQSQIASDGVVGDGRFPTEKNILKIFAIFLAISIASVKILF